MIQHLGKKRSHLLSRSTKSHGLTYKYTEARCSLDKPKWMKHYNYFFNTGRLTIIVKSDFVRQRVIQRGKHWTLMLKETPFGAISISFLLPPDLQKQRDRSLERKDKHGSCSSVAVVCVVSSGKELFGPKMISPLPLLLFFFFGFLSLCYFFVFCLLFGFNVLKWVKRRERINMQSGEPPSLGNVRGYPSE